jgi:SAM-dependent methyltransferase
VTPEPGRDTTAVPELGAVCKNDRMSDRQMRHIDPPSDLEQIYSRRFNSHIAYRNQVWKVLTGRFFSQYISPEAVTLDLGCGYGEFINNVTCKKKFAMDLNPAARQHIAPEVEFIEQDCSHEWQLPDESLDVVFTSNFFEHLPSKQALSNTVLQAKRHLKRGGRIIALGPNVRHIGGAYWDFWDHHLALTDRSLTEHFEMHGFRIERVLDRFLPYTMVNARRAPTALVSLYLLFPPIWRLMGRQFLIIASKP